MRRRRPPIPTSYLRLALVVGLAMASLALTAQSAAASSPWWHLLTLSAPPAQGASEGEVVMFATDLGDAPASDSAHPVIIKDVLPSGVQVTAAHPEGGGGARGYEEQHEHAHCTWTESEVTCTYPVGVLPFEEAIAIIDVKVATPGAGTGVNEASVSGGLLGPATQRQALALEALPPFGVAHLDLSPEEDGGEPALRAGSHPFQLTSTFALNTQAVPVVNGEGEHFLSIEPLALPKDLRFNVPAGLVANATALPRCTDYVFSQQVRGIPGFRCPDETQIGVASSIITRDHPISPLLLVFPLYNLEPGYGEPARFGFSTPVNVPVILDTEVDASSSEKGVTVIAPNVTQLAAVIGAQTTFWGWPADPRHDSQRGNCLRAEPVGGQLPSCPLSERPPRPFMVMPTSCAGPLQTSVEADSWEEPVLQAPFLAQPPIPQMQACNQVQFSPTIKAQTSTDDASASSGLDLNIDFNDEGLLNPEGTAQSQIKKTVVTLPEGMTINPSAGVGLGGCTEADYARETVNSAPGAGCPENSKLGTVTIESPLLAATIHGNVYIAQPYENPFGEPPAHPHGTLLALYIVAKNPENGILVKLAGKVTPDPVTGRLVTTFEGVPQLPFDHFDFHFREGAQAPLITPSACGIYTVQADLTPWSQPESSLTDTAPFQITKGFNEGPCPSGGVPPFSPQVITGTQDNRAGSYSPFYLRILREDDEQEITRFSTIMPPGLTGNLTGIPFCSDQAIEHARQATGREEIEHPSCPAASEIGHTLVGAGVGTTLAWTPGKIYLAGSYHGSALSIVSVTSATVGPFDLGTVVIRFALKINPITAQAEIDSTGSDPVPHIIDGIVVHVRDIHAYIDRPNFIINPTNCTPMTIHNAITGAQTVEVTSRFQAADCQALKFKPSFTASTSGHTSRANGASLDVKLTYPKTPQGTEANIARVKVSLPKALPSRLGTLQKACLATTFEQNPAACPPASRVGTAKATTPILPERLVGPAYFVSYGGLKFPELVVVLQGYGITVDLYGETFIGEKSGITSSTFRTIPDVPVGTFELKLPQGRYSALAANGKLCGRKLTMPTTFTAQNGLVMSQATAIKVTGCAKRKPKHRRPKKK